MQNSVRDYLTDLGPVSGGANLLRSALLLPQEPGDEGTSVPSMMASATGAAFVGEMVPLPVKAFATSLIKIEPRKVGLIAAFTREMTARSSFETVLRRVMDESAGLALDAALFSSAAASGTTPAGLRNGLSAIAATAGGGYGAMMKDLGNLAAAVAPVGGDSIAFVGAPDVAVKLRLAAGRDFAYPIFPSAALATGTLVAIALPALAAAVDPVPEIEAANSAVLHLGDETPLAIGTPGSPATIAAPARSLFQTDSIALRLVFGVSWALRAPGSVAFITGVTW